MIRNSFLFLFLFLVTSTKGYFVNEEECLNYTVYPVQYELIIIPYIYQGNYNRFYYECEETITVIANAQVDIIELDAKDLEIREGSIQVLDGNRNIVNAYRPYEFDKARGKLIIYLSESLSEYQAYKKQYLIKISFTKYVKGDSADGVFFVKYFDDGIKYLISTRLSPDKAKYFFPCFDEVKFEAVFKFKVYAVMRQGVQQCNTSLVIAKEQNQNTAKEFTIIDYIPSPQVGVHQVGFHTSQFGSRQVTAHSTNDTLIIWAPTPMLVHYTFILEFGNHLINLIHEYAMVSRPLVYGPINIVSLPSNIDGYELGSWNLLTNGDHRLQHIYHFTSIRQIELMMFQLSQQLSRIWLGNPGELERTRWQEEWFKEGVATYLAYYFLEQYNTGAHTNLHQRPLGFYGLEMRHNAMAVDWEHSTPALITFNRTLAVQIPPRYHELVTKKTASILWMVENWIGTEKFHNALVKYINSRRGKVISLVDFMDRLDLDTVECEQQFFNGSTASRVLQSWFDTRGYPVVNVQVFRDREPNVILLKQRHFSFNNAHRDDSNYLIPISYIVQHNQNCFNCFQPRFTIDKQSYSFGENLNGGWIILNTNASGYYRVNYDADNWILIAKSLKDNPQAIATLNRAQIVNDVFALYAAGDLDYYLAQDILGYLDKEMSLAVWKAAIEGFDYLKIEGAACQMSRAVYDQWQSFMRQKIAKVYHSVVKGEDQQRDSRMLRSKVVQFACSLDYRPCAQYMNRIFDEHRRGTQRLNPDYRQACYSQIEKNHNVIKKDNVNIFELEDLEIAERKLREEKRFLIRLPFGQAKPEHIISTILPPVVDKPSTPTAPMPITKPNSAIHHFASILTIILTFVNLTISLLEF